MYRSLLPMATMLLAESSARGAGKAPRPSLATGAHAVRRGGEARIHATLPDVRQLPGFHEIPLGDAWAQSRAQPREGVASRRVLKRYLRESDGARLEIEVQQSHWAGSRAQQQAEAEVQSAGGALH